MAAVTRLVSLSSAPTYGYTHRNRQVQPIEKLLGRFAGL